MRTAQKKFAWKITCGVTKEELMEAQVNAYYRDDRDFSPRK